MAILDIHNVYQGHTQVPAYSQDTIQVMSTLLQAWQSQSDEITEIMVHKRDHFIQNGQLQGISKHCEKFGDRAEAESESTINITWTLPLNA